jgi:hypothetical protein
MALVVSIVCVWPAGAASHRFVQAVAAAPRPATSTPTPAVPSRRPTPRATPTPLPTATPTMVPVPVIDAIPQPSAVAAPPRLGTTLDGAVLYDNGAQILALPSGGGAVALANLSPSPYPFKRPRFTGWQFIYYDQGFFLGDIFARHTPLLSPATGNESVYDAWPSPDGQYIAWVLVKPGPWRGVTFSMASSRIVLTNISGQNPRTLLQQDVDAAGGVPILYGWRFGHPATVLVQSSYGFAGLHRGLLEFDPQAGDLVGDWLPPTGEATLPTGEVLGLSPSGQTIVFAGTDGLLPTGEGPLPSDLWVMTLAGRQARRIDLASQYRDKAAPGQPAPSAYRFARQAFVSPDETLVAYTRLDVTYPRGALAPVLRPIAVIARISGAGKADLAAGFRAVGWLDNNTVLLRLDGTAAAGLYACDLTTARKRLLARGANLTFDGIVP